MQFHQFRTKVGTWRQAPNERRLRRVCNFFLVTSLMTMTMTMMQSPCHIKLGHEQSGIAPGNASPQPVEFSRGLVFKGKSYVYDSDREH